MWKKNNSAIGVNCWEEISTCKLKDAILYSTWGSQHSVIVTEHSLFILQEHELSSNYNKQVRSLFLNKYYTQVKA